MSSSSMKFTAFIADVEEMLYPAIEDFRVDILIDSGLARARSARPPAIHGHRRHDAPGLVTAPLRGRFGMAVRLKF